MLTFPQKRRARAESAADRAAAIQVASLRRFVRETASLADWLARQVARGPAWMIQDERVRHPQRRDDPRWWFATGAGRYILADGPPLKGGFARQGRIYQYEPIPDAFTDVVTDLRNTGIASELISRCGIRCMGHEDWNPGELVWVEPPRTCRCVAPDIPGGPECGRNYELIRLRDDIGPRDTMGEPSRAGPPDSTLPPGSEAPTG